MSFVYPSFLLALLSLGIPIIIHLFHFRRFKKVYFTNVRFLKEVKQETQQQSRIKHLLVLLARCFALAFLVFAFAQPFIAGKNAQLKAGRKDVSIFVDNSFSMSSQSQDVPLLEKARRRATEIVSAYSADDRFQILTCNFEGREQRLLSKEEALSAVNEIQVSPASREMTKILARQKQALNGGNADHKSAYIISDFQKNITNFDKLRDTTIDLYLIPLQSVRRKNVAIDTAWFEAPVRMLNQTNQLIVRLQNYSEEAAENIELSLNVDGQNKPVGTLSIPARGKMYDTINYTIVKTGWQEAELAITDFPINFDDHYFFSFKGDEKVNVLHLHDGSPNRYLEAAFKNNTHFKSTAQSSGNIDYSKLKEYQLIILAELKTISSGLASELSQYIDAGGNVLIFPSAAADINAYNNFTNSVKASRYGSFEKTLRSVSFINYEEFVFRDVFSARRDNVKLPDTKGNFALQRTAASREEVILRYRDGGVFVGKNTYGKGNIYICASPLDPNYSNLTQSGEIFVPMLYKMALSSGKDEKIAYTIGKDNMIETIKKVTGNETVFKLRNNASEFIPEQKTIGTKAILSLGNEIKEAGFYQLYIKAQEILGKYAFNYNRKESELEYITTNELKMRVGANVDIIEGTKAADFSQTVGERSKGIIFWKYCLIITLIFLAIEQLLLRFWR
jgi:hypothetical protein